MRVKCGMKCRANENGYCKRSEIDILAYGKCGDFREKPEFDESKAASQGNGSGYQNDGSNNYTSGDSFMNIPDDIDEELPFN